MKGRVLIVAGSDSGGGAGVQADIKTLTALDAFAMTAITALTAQNTLGVHGVFAVDPDFIRRQIACVAADIGVDCVKIGMLGAAPAIEAVAAALAEHTPHVPIVLDPVMTAKGGASLLPAEAVDALRRRLLPRALVVTPNLPEAAALTGLGAETVDDMAPLAAAIRAQGPRWVLVKGGHLKGVRVVDLLLGPDGARTFADARIDTVHTHGTGCTLASAIAAGLAQGVSVGDAVARARAYVRQAIQTAPGLGHGHGPLNHAVTVDMSRLES